jgi:serine/threonine protein kinase
MDDDILNAATIANRLIQLGLIQPHHLDEARVECGQREPEPMLLLQVLERKGYLTPWQSSKVLKGDNAGYFLGGYRILYRVASGSFGRVFRADEPATGRIVAVKVLRRRWSENQDQIGLFTREGRLGMSLKHPNIVEILAMSHDKASDQYYIVMEFVEGGNLREILQMRTKLPAAEALHYMEDAASGLAYAFSQGFAHRDMKLTNILISSSGSAKLVDFGLAQMYAGMMGAFEEVKSKGKGKDEPDRIDRTVDYAGLEKATDVKPGDVRSDIFFLGCVLYECLTGRSPLEMTRDRHARMHAARFTNIPPMRRDEVNAPPSVFALVETMMSLDPLRRYQTPSQLLEAIRSCRRDVEGKAASGAKTGGYSIFLVEGDPRLQEALREKFKELGYRVFLAADPMRALDRFRQQPYDALIVDVGTTDQEGVNIFNHILMEAGRKEIPCVGIAILNEDQAHWKDRIEERPRAAVMIRPVTLKQLYKTLTALLKDH